MSSPSGTEITGQVGYEAHPRIYLLNDEVPLFLRSLYKEYAILIRPWELEPDIPKNRKGPETPVGPAAYEFFEDPGRWAVDKTFVEAVFLQRLRNLVMEDGQSLWLARAMPRAWLEQGKKISVKHAPTYFGPVAYEIVSDPALLQGLGRLLRHREDRGVLAVLDLRLKTMGYVRRFLASLPPSPVTHRIDDVAKFFAS